MFFGRQAVICCKQKKKRKKKWQNKHICTVTCPIPLIAFSWSTIRLSFGPPLENIVWIIMLYRASVYPPPHTHPLSLAYVICSRSCMAPSAEYPPSAHPVMHSFISVPLILGDPAEGLTCYEHGCCTALAAKKKKKTLSVPGRGCAALMCHAICMDWLTVAFSSTSVCLHEQPPLSYHLLLEMTCQGFHRLLNVCWG